MINFKIIKIQPNLPIIKFRIQTMILIKTYTNNQITKVNLPNKIIHMMNLLNKKNIILLNSLHNKTSKTFHNRNNNNMISRLKKIYQFKLSNLKLNLNHNISLKTVINIILMLNYHQSIINM